MSDPHGVADPDLDPVPEESKQQPLNHQLFLKIQEIGDDLANLDTTRFDDPALYPMFRELETLPADLANQSAPTESPWPVDDVGQPMTRTRLIYPLKEPAQVEYQEDNDLALAADPFAQQEDLDPLVADA